ncbi:MAG: Pseudouridine synthase [Verrucomicrobiales bacterium]|nr:Pseudouridine synthase [Verrucomicrobiales bacterium]
MSEIIKLSSPNTKEFWEIPILFEDEALLALEKPSRLLTSPDRYDPNRPNLMKLLHKDLERNAPWVRPRKLTYLMNAHRLDFETSGIILLAKNKPALVFLADLFGSEKPYKRYMAMVAGNGPVDEFTVDKALSPHPVRLGEMKIDDKNGKKSKTLFKVVEKFRGFSLVECVPLTGRTHQIRIHLKAHGTPILGDTVYGGPPLMLSSIKRDFRLKPRKTENALMARVALHATELRITSPATNTEVTIQSELPKDFRVALKYLRMFAPV